MLVFAPLLKLKLSHQLFIGMIAIPMVVVTVMAYFFAGGVASQAVGGRIGEVAFCLFLGLGYLLFALIFIGKTTSRIILAKDAVSQLAMGKVAQNVCVMGSDEIAQLVATVHELNVGLNRAAEFTWQIETGNLQADFQPRSEEDILGLSLLKMRESLANVQSEGQQRHWTSEGQARFVEILRSNDNLQALSNDIITTLVRLLQANQGALFIRKEEPDGSEFLEMQACYAYQRKKNFVQKMAPGEGLVGQAFLEKDTIYLTDIPDDFIRITSGLGGANPTNVLITPLKMNEEVVGIIELASFKALAAHEIAFVEKIGENIAHAISSFGLAEDTRKLLKESQAQTEQMRAQEEELRQNQEELEATQEEISRKYNELFKQLFELNYQAKFDQLKSINSTKKRNIEFYFEIIRNQMLTFSENPMVVEAVKDFKAAFAQVGDGVTESQLLTFGQSLQKYYAEEFLPRLQDNSHEQKSVESFLPETDKASILQYQYMAQNPHPTGQKSLLDDAQDGSEYSKVHARYHPVMRSFLEKFGYYDIFLIDPETGDMLYSVFKEVDFATSLLSGLYHTTNFGTVVKEAIQSHDPGFLKLIDFEPYAPSYLAPASFIACPIYEKDQKIGILVFQMPINKMNQILTGDHQWREDGLGESGETFIVGSDYKLRSIARELTEDEGHYLSTLKAAGYSEAVLHQIQTTKTSILLEEVKLDSVRKALRGESGTQIEKNNRGIDMLHAFAPLDIPDVHWMIMSTTKEEEASMKINNLRNG
jgi:hypothetical protein